MTAKSIDPIDMFIDEQAAVGTLLELLGINGISGSEARIRTAIVTHLIRYGCHREDLVVDSFPQNEYSSNQDGNLILRLPGTISAKRRLFISHMDTVPLCRGAQPVMKEDRIVAASDTGLGADNRSGVACLLAVIEAILHNKLDYPPLTFLFTVGEEVGLIGAKNVNLADLLYPKMGFNIDSGIPEEFIIGAVGADRWEVDIYGRSSHAGVHPEHGISATTIAAIAIEHAARLGYLGKIEQNKNRGTANIGIIRGGEATNQVTDHVYIKGESRSFEIEFIDEITNIFRSSIELAIDRVRNSENEKGRYLFRIVRDYSPFVLDTECDVANFSFKTAEQSGLQPSFRRVHGGLDANALNEKGVPTITLGAGQHHAHTRDEYVDVGEYLRGCRLALALATAKGD